MPPKGWGDAAADAKMRKTAKALEVEARKAAQAVDAEVDEAKQAELRTLLVGMGFPALLADELLERLSGSKLKWAFCPDCRRKVQVDAVDERQSMKALEMALGYTIGKPKERRELDVTVTQKPLVEMTLAEKQQYLAELESKTL